MTYQYVFQYKDHLGNVRVSYNFIPPSSTVIGGVFIKEENNYYPFGLKHGGYNVDASVPVYKYKFLGQERQDELGLNWDTFRHRNYDYAIGRFMSVDPIAEDFVDISTNQFAHNNPVWKVELEGLEGIPFQNLAISAADGVGNFFKNTASGLKSEAAGLVNAYKNIGTNPVATLKYAAGKSGPALIYKAVKSQVEKPINIIQKAASGDINGAVSAYSEHLTEGVVALITGGVAKGGTGIAASRASAGESTLSKLQGVANKAKSTIGEGSGAVHGTKVHSEFGKLASEIEGVSTEVSYKNGEVVPYGTKGSVRADAVEGNIQSPAAIYNLKTGNAKLSPGNISKYKQHVLGTPPVHEIKPH